MKIRTTRILQSTLIVLITIFSLAPLEATACGGMFCSIATPNSPPEPVDQTGEWIVFEVGEDEVTVHVQIQYTGTADEFAWIVPVSGVPNVEESSAALISSLSDATTMQLLTPTLPFCPGAEPVAPSGGGDDSASCACGSDDSNALLESSRAPNADSPSDDPVQVLTRDVTNNYEFVVLAALSSQDIVDWLQTNNFNVSDNMVPVMSPYTDAEMHFLAVKLRDGKAASDIAPLKFNYPGTTPMIPLKLTAVAAQPLMGIQVFILADRPYLPENFASSEPDMRALLLNENGESNYFEWVARAASEAEGKFFSIEYAGTNQSGAFPQSHLTRLYSRISPEFMTEDPVFISAVDRSYTHQAVLNYQDQVSVFCNEFGIAKPIEERLPSACGYNYCGVDSTCHELEGTAYCKCAAGQVAQTVKAPDSSTRVTCVPRSNPLGITALAGGEGSPFDPCADFDCGAGQCVLKSGFPACLCDTGAMAYVDANNTLSCGVVDGDLAAFGPGAGGESRGSVAPLTNEQPLRQGLKLGSALSLFIGLLGAMLLRRRRED